MIKCPNCEQENRRGARFCQYCGASLEASAVSEVTGPAEVSADQPVDETAPERDTSPHPEWLKVDGAIDDAEMVASAAESEIEAVEPPAAAEKIEPVAIEAVESGSADSEWEQQEPSAESISESGSQDVEPAAVGQAEAVGLEEADQVDVSAAGLDVAGEDETSPSASPVVSEQPEPLEKDGQTASQDASFEEPEPSSYAEESQPFGAAELEDFSDEQPQVHPFEGQDAEALFWRDESTAMTPLESGTVVKGRYQISQVLSAESQEILYRVRDLQRCPQCGFDDNSPDQAFCDACGAMLDQKTPASMLERPAGQEEEPVDATVEDHFQEVDRVYWVWRETKHAALSDDARPFMSLAVGQKSDVGQKRDLNEDSMFALTWDSTYESAANQLALLVVADGIGGHEGGEVASKLAIQASVGDLLSAVIAEKLAGRPISDQVLHDRMIQAVQLANEQVFLERQKRETDMGTTLTMAVLQDWVLYIAHVGDCRAFRFGENGLQQLTTDHSVVASMIAAGSAKPEEIYTHPQRSIIYRSIGDRPSVSVDWEVFAVMPGDRVVVCSDGLWEMIRNEGIEEVLMLESDPQNACEMMVDQANVAGGLDNISVIVVQL